ncbi:MAG: hypothetical protein D8M57_10945 [Candidatus Scalindua sp. AMX11]|nr:MAG: hypothetical protein DWQ00_16110 [Candidatus Scalindua sp.]NOG83724.1 hypothetical protein [Planctomycetota bacterium]RZV73826.1 MAG: hypothetical protein EX341_13290 [Candidatus Scalindua sp. SCAELEC01]TDE64832.1 MAG: hypothetical protein D8M57_10945 [Candidatus Scalindua sp. AMX11]
MQLKNYNKELVRTMLLGIIILSLLSTSLKCTLYAVETKQWIDTEESDFAKGKLENVSIQSTGRLTLSPMRQKREEIPAAYVWCQASKKADTAFVGTGDPGTIFMINQFGKIREFYKTPDLHIQTIAIDTFGNVYAGTIPHGRIYRVSPDGKGELFCDLPDPYVWDLLFDNNGCLYAATGDNGIIYKISEEGTPSVFFDSPSTNILDLVINKDNTVYAACEPQGIIYKVTESGKASVLYDTKEGEIHCLAIDRDGVVYAGTSSGTPPTLTPSLPLQPEFIPLPPPQAEMLFETNANSHDLVNAPYNPGNGIIKEAFEQSIATGQNSVYRIDEEGRVRELLTIEDSFVLSLSLDTNDDLLVGTGNRAKLLKINNHGDISLLYNFDESQILDIITYQDGNHSIATGNSAGVYLLTNEYSHNGTYDSAVLDSSYVSTWGSISWNSQTPPQTETKLFTRSGNSRRPDITWSNWSRGYVKSGEKITSPAARFIQYRILFTTRNPASTPTIDHVGIHYLPQNQAPFIERIGVTSDEGGEEGEGSKVEKPLPSKCISWTSSDPNSDTLTFDLKYKKIGEKRWRNLKSDISSEEQYIWETQSLPDGYYQVKIVASDIQSNPEILALTDEKQSSTFLIDNTSPTISQVTKIIKDEDDILTITGNTRDELCTIREIRYSIDAGEHRTIFPKDNIFDSNEETFQLDIPYASSKGHNVVIEAVDAEGNVGNSRKLYIP